MRYFAVFSLAVFLCSIGLCGSWISAAVQQEEAQGETTSDPVSEVPAASPAERRTWDKVADTEDMDKKAKAAEKYLEDFPEGVYTAYAHEILAVHARQNNNLKDFYEHGELAVQGLPQSLILEVSLAVAYAEDQKPEPAIRHGERALSVLPNLVPSEGGQITEQRRQAMLADTNYALGTAYLFQGFNKRDRAEVAKSINYLETSVRLNGRDERSQFRLAFAYQMTRQTDKAVEAFARAVALEGANEAMARQYLEQAYKSKNGSLEGLEELIDQQRILLTLQSEGP